MSDYIIDVATEMEKDGWNFDDAIDVIVDDRVNKVINDYVESICEKVLNAKYRNQ